MNEERTPINLFILDVENGHEMTPEELKKQKTHDIQSWVFLICASLIFALVLCYIGVKGTLDMVGILVALFLLLIVLIALSVYKIVKIRNRG